jgi:hypothetical protein
LLDAGRASSQGLGVRSKPALGPIIWFTKRCSNALTTTSLK